MQIRQLFGFCGGVIGVDRVGEEKQYVFVEYTYPAVQLRPYNLFVLHKVCDMEMAFLTLSGPLSIDFEQGLSCAVQMTVLRTSAW